MASSPEKTLESMIKNMPEKTGKSLVAWLKIVDASGFRKHGEIIKHLKSEHGMTHGFANLVANRALDGGNSNAETLIEAQYVGVKKQLRPIYDRIAEIALSFGSDVQLSPKKAYVSLRRSKQFALVQPSTKTRVDLGINLKGVDPQGNLEASGSFNSMVTHRVRLESVADIDKEVKAWLKLAYEQA